jgi:hypothetical protein
MSLTEGTVLQISDWEFTSDKDSLVVVVELENVTSNDVEGVRLDVRGFSLDGRAVATVQGTANRVVGEDYRSLRVRLPLTQPIFWIGFQVQDYRGRRPSDRLHSALASVPVELYAESALGRVKVAAAVLPPRPAASHLLCLHITDTGGLPLRAVEVSVTLKGPSQRGELEQVMEAKLAPSKGTSMTVKWEAPTHPVVQVRIKAVDFAALPSAQ